MTEWHYEMHNCNTPITHITDVTLIIEWCFPIILWCRCFPFPDFWWLGALVYCTHWLSMSSDGLDLHCDFFWKHLLFSPKLGFVLKMRFSKMFSQFFPVWWNKPMRWLNSLSFQPSSNVSLSMNCDWLSKGASTPIRMIWRPTSNSMLMCQHGYQPSCNPSVNTTLRHQLRRPRHAH